MENCHLRAFQVMYGPWFQINKKNPATHTFLIVTRHKLVCSPMACPAALIPCRGINSVRTWSRSLLTLCIQATSTANHLAKEIGRYRKRPETSKISWETNDVAAEWSISQLSQPLNGGHRPCHRRVSRRLHGSSDSEARKDQNVLPTSTTTTSHDGVWGQAAPFITWIVGSPMAYWKVASPSKECENKSQNVEIKWLYFDLYTPRLPVHWMTK